MLVYDRHHDIRGAIRYRLIGWLEAKTRMPVLHFDRWGSPGWCFAKLTRTVLTTEYGATFQAWVMTGDVRALQQHSRFRPLGASLETLEQTVARIDLGEAWICFSGDMGRYAKMRAAERRRRKHSSNK